MKFDANRGMRTVQKWAYTREDTVFDCNNEYSTPKWGMITHGRHFFTLYSWSEMDFTYMSAYLPNDEGSILRNISHWDWEEHHGCCPEGNSLSNITETGGQQIEEHQRGLRGKTFKNHHQGWVYFLYTCITTTCLQGNFFLNQDWLLY